MDYQMKMYCDACNQLQKQEDKQRGPHKSTALLMQLFSLGMGFFLGWVIFSSQKPKQQSKQKPISVAVCNRHCCNTPINKGFKLPDKETVIKKETTKEYE